MLLDWISSPGRWTPSNRPQWMFSVILSIIMHIQISTCTGKVLTIVSVLEVLGREFLLHYLWELTRLTDMEVLPSAGPILVTSRLLGGDSAEESIIAVLTALKLSAKVER